MDIKNYYLDINKVSKIENIDERRVIHEYYRDMLFSLQDSRSVVAASLFNSLWYSGFLREVREDKINEILS